MRVVLLTAVLALASAAYAQKGPPPAPPVRAMKAASLPKVGQCYMTKIKEVSSRLEGDPDSGTAVVYTNGLYQVDYGDIPALIHSKRSDPVRLCVTKVPKNCPRDDVRGIEYRGRNLRTGGSWEAADSEHMCGGL